jgi:hypothetical protein
MLQTIEVETLAVLHRMPAPSERSGEARTLPLRYLYITRRQSWASIF